MKILLTHLLVFFFFINSLLFAKDVWEYTIVSVEFAPLPYNCDDPNPMLYSGCWYAQHGAKVLVSFTLNDGMTYAPSSYMEVIPDEFNVGTLMVNTEWTEQEHFTQKNIIVFRTHPLIDGNRYGLAVRVIGHNIDFGETSKVTSIDLEQGIVYFSGYDSKIHSFLIREDLENVNKIRDWKVGDSIVMGLKTLKYSGGMPPTCGNYPILHGAGESRMGQPWYICTYNTLMNLSQLSQKPPFGCIMD